MGTCCLLISVMSFRGLFCALVLIGLFCLIGNCEPTYQESELACSEQCQWEDKYDQCVFKCLDMNCYFGVFSKYLGQDGDMRIKINREPNHHHKNLLQTFELCWNDQQKQKKSKPKTEL